MVKTTTSAKVIVITISRGYREHYNLRDIPSSLVLNVTEYFLNI